MSKMVKELILDNDKVALPGLGSFVAEIVPSTFSDKGYTINPPYRRLYFRSRVSDGDELISLYAANNKVDKAVAERIITDFLSELKSILFVKKTVVFPGLGRMRATKENTIFFVADEELDIYPDGFALEPISLKAHKETPEEVSNVMSELKSYIGDNPVEETEDSLDLDLPTPATTPEPASEPVSEPASEPVSEPASEPDQVSDSEPIQDLEATSQPSEIEEAECAVETETSEETAVQTVAQVETANEPSSEHVSAPETLDTETVATVPAKPRKRKAGKVILIIFIVLIVLAILAFVAFMVIAKVQPELLDKILYSAEELEVINYNFNN